MRSFVGPVALLVGGTLGAQSSSAPRPIPAWAFPTTTSPFVETKAPFDTVTRHRVPGSTRRFTMAEVKDRFAPPDWYPRLHGEMPASVAKGRKPAMWACGYCHLPDGQGRSENATLAGLPVEYFIRQVEDFRSRARRGVVEDWGPTANMIRAVDSATTGEIAEAARYFAGLRARPRYRVVERALIPRTMQVGGLYAVQPGGGTEPLDERIVEITDDLERHELRDPNESFRAYVPVGSIARGRRLATPAKPGASCASCHGPALRGTAVAPPIAGRSPLYLFRQLLGFSTGARAGPAAAPMRALAGSLSDADMIALSAYVGSLRP